MALSKEKLREMHIEYLKKEGYQTSVDIDGDVILKYEGGVYCIVIDEKDPGFFYLIHPNFWPIENPEEMLRAALISSMVNAAVKACKITVNRNDNISASIQAYHASPEDFKGVFSRNIQALQCGINTFKTKMREIVK